MQNLPLKVSGAIFVVIAVMHLVRFILGTPVIVGTHVLPVWASAVAFVASALLAMWTLKASCCCRKEG